VSETRRCPNCGALVAADAEWCGQCYQPLRSAVDAEPPSDAEHLASADPGTTASAGAEDATGRSARAGATAGATLETPGGGVVEIADGGRATWTCPICQEVNELDRAFCRVCGTPFARLFAEPEPPPQVDPERAAVWSLAFPGLGHWRLNRKADAVARFVLFGWTFGTLAVIVVSRFGKGGLGPTLPLVALFAFAALTVYVLSALDAYRIANRDDPLVSSRTLLWASAGLVVTSVLLATMLTFSARR
jgi:RNA polymerase subunit RPABC4/transcription elongation factor Spt4